jgi:hypothetical protein
MHTKFHKYLFRHLKVNREGFTDTQTAWSSQFREDIYCLFKKFIISYSNGNTAENIGRVVQKEKYACVNYIHFIDTSYTNNLYMSYPVT